MERLGEVWRRLLFLFHGSRFNREMEEEIRFHLESEAEQIRASGMSEDDARDAAHRRFGNAGLLKEKTREAWGWGALDHIGQDLKFAHRSLSRSPGFTLIVVLTLAFGIGVNTAIFSAVNALLLNPYPFPEADRLVSVEAYNSSGNNGDAGYQDFLDWQRQNSVFDAMAIVPFTRSYMLTGQAEPRRITGGTATAEFWKVLGIQPALGRFFTEEDDLPGAAQVAVLTWEACEQRYGKDPVSWGVR
jgi:putative ABC transport system permease protein